VAHEALLRRPLIDGWLQEQKDALKLRDDVLREAKEWRDGGRRRRDLVRPRERLKEARKLAARPDFRNAMAPAKAYLTACWRSAMRGRVFVGTLAASVFGLLGLAATGVLEPNAMKVQARRFADLHMPAIGTMPALLTAEKERALKARDRFQECWSCPEMVVVPAGEFMMGANDGGNDEKPVRKVTISAALAIGRFEVTFDEWDGCVAHGGCPAEGVAGANFGRGRQPVINVSWEDAKKYVEWLSKRTGKTYRLLTEAEWEYAARAGTTTPFSFGDDDEALGEHAWFSGNSESRTHVVGGKKANPFGLYDMHGNVYEWVEDCYVDNYNGAPTDGTSWKEACKGKTSSRVVRGGSWLDRPVVLRSSLRGRYGPVLRRRPHRLPCCPCSLSCQNAITPLILTTLRFERWR
jgi:formylglycine-generating enzyme required for sulfatase activity